MADERVHVEISVENTPFAKGGIINSNNKGLLSDDIPEPLTRHHHVYSEEAKRKFAEIQRVVALEYLFDQRD